MEIEYFENYTTYQEAMAEKRLKLFESFPENKNKDSKSKIIKLLELEYDDLEKQLAALIYSNEEMLNIDASDLELIECRAVNIKFIEKNIKRLKEIKEEILNLDKDNKIKNKDESLVFNLDDYEYNKADLNQITNINLNNEYDLIDKDEDIIKELNL